MQLAVYMPLLVGSWWSAFTMWIFIVICHCIPGRGNVRPIWTSTIHIHSPIGLNMYIKYMYQYDNWITLTTKLPDNWYCAHKRAYTPPRVLYWMNSMASSSEAWAYNWGKCLLTGAIILINFNSNCYSNAWNNPLSRPPCSNMCNWWLKKYIGLTPSGSNPAEQAQYTQTRYINCPYKTIHMQ